MRNFASRESASEQFANEGFAPQTQWPDNENDSQNPARTSVHKHGVQKTWAYSQEETHLGMGAGLIRRLDLTQPGTPRARRPTAPVSRHLNTSPFDCCKIVSVAFAVAACTFAPRRRPVVGFPIGIGLFGYLENRRRCLCKFYILNVFF